MRPISIPRMVFLLISLLAPGAPGVARADAIPVFAFEWGGVGTGPGQFRLPVSVALGPGGEVYVLDMLNERIQKFDQAGTFLAAWSLVPYLPGPTALAHNLATDAAGNVYVAAGGGGTQRVFVLSPAGSFVRDLGTVWSAPDPGWGNPTSVALDAFDRVIVIENDLAGRGCRAQASGEVDLVFGTFGAAPGEFDAVQDVWIDDASRVWVPQHLGLTGEMVIDQFTMDGAFVSRFPSQDGSGTTFSATGVTSFGSTLYLSAYDAGPNRGRVLLFDLTGQDVGQFGVPGTGPAQLWLPSDIAVDPAGHFFVVDAQRCMVLRYDIPVTDVERTTMGALKHRYR